MARLSTAALLTGYHWSLSIVTSSSTVTIGGTNLAGGTYPTISRSGQVIGATRVRPSAAGRAPKIVAAVYSVAANKWTEFPPEIEHLPATVAISADGAKLALAYWEPEKRAIFLHVIDVATGTDNTIGGPISKWEQRVWLSWSPDGKLLAISLDESSEIRAKSKVVQIVNVKSAETRTIAEGEMPAWAPSGEWIVYLDNAKDKGDPPNRALLIRPDGTERKVLATLPSGRAGDRIFHAPPVWSPDSTQLILNELYDSEATTYEIHLLRLSDLKMKTIARDVPPVYGWAPAD
jgi:dipeptidyl aminopeptidase/acylaminoacyl peptidase